MSNAGAFIAASTSPLAAAPHRADGAFVPRTRSAAAALRQRRAARSARCVRASAQQQREHEREARAARVTALALASAGLSYAAHPLGLSPARAQPHASRQEWRQNDGGLTTPSRPARSTSPTEAFSVGGGGGGGSTPTIAVPARSLSLPFGAKKRPSTPAAPNPNGALGNTQPNGRTRVSSSFVTKAAEAVGPSVVRVDTERVVHGGAVDPLLDDPMFKYFFGEDFQRQIPRERTERGQGSGFIVSGDGLLLTNAHVVANANKVTVTLTDGRTYVAEVMGTDELLDLAILKIQSKGEPLPMAPLGASDDLHVGDWVIALGNPVGLDNTVTLGIVSSLNRSSAEVGIPEKKIQFIQTDAAINPGNSGGPLVNEFGEVVGISTAIRANAEGIGFAIPIDRAKAIKDALAKGQQVQHPFVGIQMTTMTPELAKQNNADPNTPAMLPECGGVLVVRVLPKTPAAESGLRRFDVIQSVDGRQITNAKDIQTIVDASSVGQALVFKAQRGTDGKVVTLQIKTGDMTVFRAAQREEGQQQQQQQQTPSLPPPGRVPHERRPSRPMPPRSVPQPPDGRRIPLP